MVLSDTGDHTRGNTDPRRSAIGWAIIAAFTILAFVRVSGSLDEPFGFSHDGFNGSVWGLSARSIRTRGLIASRLGAVTFTPTGHATYTDHPPLISLETAIAERIAGSRPVVDRAPAYVGSALTIALMFWLLQILGQDPLVAGVAVVGVFANPMFLLFGTMLDTPVTSLWLGVLLLGLAVSRPRNPWIPMVAVLVAVAASWLAAGMALVLAFGLLISRPRVSIERRFVAGWWIGLVGGGVCIVAWLWWAAGSFAGVTHAFLHRAGIAPGTHASAGLFTAAQVMYLTDMFPFVVIALLPTLVIAATSRAVRRAGLPSVIVVVAWCLVFHNGASGHEYWNYWVLVPMTLGLSALISWFVERAHFGLRTPSARWLLVGMAVAASSVGGFAVRSMGEHDRESGLDAGRLAEEVRLPKGQRLAYTAGLQAWLPFLTYYTGLEVRPLNTRADVVRLADKSPDALVFRHNGWARPALGFVRASDLIRDQ